MSRFVDGVAIAAVLLAGAVGAASAESDSARQKQLRDMSRERGDPRCASEGVGFVYEPNSGTCLRIGGMVGVQVGGDRPSNLLGR